MSTEKSRDRDPSVREIEAEIERTRAELGATVEAIGEHLDVRARAQERLRGLRSALVDDAGRPQPPVLAAAAVAVVVTAVVIVVRRRR